MISQLKYDFLAKLNDFKGCLYKQQRLIGKQRIQIKTQEGFLYCLNIMSVSAKKQKLQSYLSSHPQLTKRVASGKNELSRFQIPQKQYTLRKTELYSQQENISQILQQKVSELQHQNDLFRQSLAYFDADTMFQQLHKQLESIKREESSTSEQISHCQVVEQNTTPEEYFLFKRNKRLQTFNQAIDQLFEEVNREKQEMKRAMDQFRVETSQVRDQIEQVEAELSSNMQLLEVSPGKKDKETKSERSKASLNIKESRVNVVLESTKSSDQEKTPNFFSNQIDSDSGSSLDCNELQNLRQEYKSLLETYEIISENNEIMTTQLFNNISSIEESLNKYFETQKTRVFRDITQVKEDFEYMPAQHIIPPTESQLKYDVAPLINDYKNKLSEIGRRLSSDLKAITVDILAPLRWESINFEQYFDIPIPNQVSQSQVNSIKESERQSRILKQSQKEYHRLQELIKKEDRQINSLQENLQEIMGETMVYKQKQHQLQLAMHNMRKMLKQQQHLF